MSVTHPFEIGGRYRNRNGDYEIKTLVLGMFFVNNSF